MEDVSYKSYLLQAAPQLLTHKFGLLAHIKEQHHNSQCSFIEEICINKDGK